MRKVHLALLAIVLNMFMFSCSDTDAAETEALYHRVATEGDDQDPTPDPPPPPPGGGSEKE